MLCSIHSPLIERNRRLFQNLKKARTVNGADFSGLSNEIKAVTIEVARILDGLREEGKIKEEDHVLIISAAAYLFQYFSDNYTELKLKEEVPRVWDSLYEKYVEKGIELGRQKGILEGRQEKNREIARNFLLLGVPIETVAQATGLSENEIKKLQ